MRLCRAPLSVIIVLVALFAAKGAPVAAQDATPPVLPVTPEAAACTVEPRSISYFEQFVGTPTAEQATPVTVATPAAGFIMPAGEVADQETVDAVTATIVELGACLNAGDFLRYGALFTDDYFQRAFAEFGPIPEEELAFLAASPEAVPAENRAAILAVLDVRLLADGRVAGLFDVYDPFEQPPGPARFYWEFVEQDGRWLIDEQVMLGSIDPAEIGTPTV